MSTVRNLLSLMALVIVSTALVSCGGSTNNDQGTSFLALGFFQDSNGNTGDAGRTTALFSDFPLEPFAADGLDIATVLSFIGVENRLTNQFIRTTKMDCSYEIPGARIAIPDDSTTYTTVLPPAVDTAGVIQTSQNFTQVIVVSSDILAFLNLNINSLPEIPFRMIATCSVTGVSQAGDVFTTNPVHYEIEFSDLVECCTGSPDDNDDLGFQENPGVGGDLNTFGDEDNVNPTGAVDPDVTISEGGE